MTKATVKPVKDTKDTKKTTAVIKPDKATKATKATTKPEIIRLKVKDNPKKKGSKSFDRFELYKDGMTVQDYCKAGGRRADIKWDVDHSFIRIES